MDKASIIKDAIEYIQELHNQEKKIREEINELESGRQKKVPNSRAQHESSSLSMTMKKRVDRGYESEGGEGRLATPIEVLEVSKHPC